MDLRNVQRTGNMFYVYLPTSWCKQWNISSHSHVQLSMTSDGKLQISPTVGEEKPKHIEMSIDEDDLDIINKLIVAAYINPASSFKIHLKETLDQAKLLEQKQLVSIELVEAEGKTITCEASVSVTDPHLLLKTILNKIKNMIIVMEKNYNLDLIKKYEEEIDRNKLLMEKSIISTLVFNRPQKVKTVHLYYITGIAKHLEGIADLLLFIDKKERQFLQNVIEKIDHLKELLGDMSHVEQFQYQTAIAFCKDINAMKETSITSVQAYHKQRIKEHFVAISEILMDMAMTNEIQE